MVSATFAAMITASVAMFTVSLLVVLLFFASVIRIAYHIMMAVRLKPVELVLLVLYQ